MAKRLEYSHEVLYNYIRVTYRTRDGICTFNARMLPGCCGVVLLDSFYFDVNDNAVENFYKELNKLLVGAKKFELNRAKIVVAAASNTELNDFCRINKWKGDAWVVNSKSGNKVRIYTLNRGVK